MQVKAVYKNPGGAAITLFFLCILMMQCHLSVKIVQKAFFVSFFFTIVRLEHVEKKPRGWLVPDFAPPLVSGWYPALRHPSWPAGTRLCATRVRAAGFEPPRQRGYEEHLTFMKNFKFINENGDFPTVSKDLK